MIKIYQILSIFILSLFIYACERDSNDVIDVLVPNGTTSFAHAQIEYENNDVVIDRVSGPNILVSAFTSGSHDIIIAPLNLGANLYNKGANYQLLGVLTWDNLQFISNEPIYSIYDLIGKDIQAFGKGVIPEMILNTILQKTDIQSQINVTYHAQSVQENYAHFTQNGGVALVAEPITSMAKSNNDNLYILDLKDVWSELTEYDRFPQAGIFVKDSLSKQSISIYLEALTSNLVTVNTNQSLIAEYTQSMDYPFPPHIVEQSLQYSGINFVPIVHCKDEVDAFMKLILTFNSGLINNELPNDNFYYKEHE